MLSVKAPGRRTGVAGAVTGAGGVSADTGADCDCPGETNEADEADEADEGLRTKLGASDSLRGCGVSAKLVACAFATGLASATVTGVACKTSPWRAGDAVDPAPGAVGAEARLESVR